MTTTSIPRIIRVAKKAAELAHIKSLPVPLVAGEKVIVEKDQTGVAKGYVKVRHGATDPKSLSVFSLRHFRNLDGKLIHKSA